MSSYQAGWEPTWQYIIRGRGLKPSRVLFAVIGENEPVAQPMRGSSWQLPEITIDEFNRQFAHFETVLAVVELAMARAKDQRMQLPPVFTAADLIVV